MRAYVYTDKSLERYAGQFVWLSIDIENSVNATFLKKYTIQGVPTMFIFDPKKEQIALRWLGSATVPQLTKLFEDGKRAVGGTRDPLVGALANADRLYGEGKNAEAAKAYEGVLGKAAEGWPSRGRVTESLLFALQSSDQFERCAKRAESAYPGMRNRASAMNVAAVGLDCALSLDKRNAARGAWIRGLEKNAIETMANPRVKVAADDRSGLYQILISTREDAGDAEGQKRVTEEWAAFLEREAAKAKTAEARAVFDSHRLSAYLALDQPDRAVAMLKESERDLPDDYNPPFRLAVAHRAAKQYELALDATGRALDTVYGPRRVRVLMTRADIYVDLGDRESATKTLADALALASALPEGQRSESTIASLKKRIESVQPSSP